MKSKVHIDDSRLMKRLEKYEQVTGKTIGDSMRRSARLLAVNLAFSTPPYGNNDSSRKLGERAVQNDILRVYTPAAPIKTKFETKILSLRETARRFLTRDFDLRDAIIAAIDAGNRIHNRHADNPQKKTTKKSKALGQSDLVTILKNAPGFNRLNVSTGVDVSLHHKTRNAYGRVRKGWKGREIVYNSKELETYIKEKQELVGMTKAGWAKAAVLVNAPVSNALRGISAWVRRHTDHVQAAVKDESEKKERPLYTLTSKVPWADKATREAAYKEAKRIAREKFYKSLNKEIREALKKARAESMTSGATA